MVYPEAGGVQKISSPFKLYLPVEGNLISFDIFLKIRLITFHLCTNAVLEGSTLSACQDYKDPKDYINLNRQETLFLKVVKKSRILDTENLSTDVDSRTDTILNRLHNFFL